MSQQFNDAKSNSGTMEMFIIHWMYSSSALMEDPSTFPHIRVVSSYIVSNKRNKTSRYVNVSIALQNSTEYYSWENS